jgi:hypothetical protein
MFFFFVVFGFLYCFVKKSCKLQDSSSHALIICQIVVSVSFHAHIFGNYNLYVHFVFALSWLDVRFIIYTWYNGLKKCMFGWVCWGFWWGWRKWWNVTNLGESMIEYNYFGSTCSIKNDQVLTLWFCFWFDWLGC